MDNVEKISEQQARQYGPRELLGHLKMYNRMDDLLVNGMIKKQANGAYWLHNVRTRSGDCLHYPIEGIPQNKDAYMGVYIGFGLVEFNDGDLVEAELRLAVDEERRKHSNPFLLSIPQNTIKLLEEIPQWAIMRSGSKLLVGKSLEKRYIKAHQSDLDRQLAPLEEKLRNETVLLEQVRDDLTKLQYATTAEEVRVSELKNEGDKLMSSNERLRSYVREKADWLLRLDLINAEQRGEICGDKLIEKRDKCADSIDFKSELGGDFRKLITVVQAHLYHQGIYYPRFLLEDFVTLLRTHDIIILSGLSGSGKTQIVKAVAQTLGGESRIIAVKPNWTSSEDLVGYYNPLQRTYLKTQFLDAILETSRHPDQLYLICLDEMNLARPEYYFADFLSHLEERSKAPVIPLYSENESEHVRSELRLLLASLKDLEEAIGKNGVRDLEHIISQPGVTERLSSLFGADEGKSFLSVHSRLRRMLAGVLDVNANLKVPTNIRFVGSVNIDQTTYNLSPKILDRAHVIRFASPLACKLKDIEKEIQDQIGDLPRDKAVYVAPELMGSREEYPDYDPSYPIISQLVSWHNEFFYPLGIDIACRTLRQARLYAELYEGLSDDGSVVKAAVINNIIKHKILPRFSLDGRIKFKSRDRERDRLEIVGTFKSKLADELNALPTGHLSAVDELDRIIVGANSNNGVVNYWA